MDQSFLKYMFKNFSQPKRRPVTSITPMDRGQAYFKSIFKTLRSIKRPGKFATGGTCDLSQPLISVVGMSPLNSIIGLPLCESQANSLIAACAQAPYGKGAETIVDTSVRCTWQLDPEQFTINNSTTWKEQVDVLLRNVVQELGCEMKSGIHCELYKLLLYQSGGFFKPHRDTEKTKGMFGTMIIQLPSIYNGGELNVRHQSKEENFSFGGGMENGGQFFYAAFYADCVHEIKPVTEGYRLCLVYNLVYTGSTGMCPSPANYNKKIGSIMSAMNDWENDNDDSSPDMMVYILDHKYLHSINSFNSLKPTDRAVADVLIEAYKKKEFDVFLGAISAHQHWYGGYNKADTLDEETISIESLVLPNSDSAINCSYDVEKDCVVPVSFMRGKPDDEDFEGYTGNEGCTLDKQYSFTALILWPSKHRPQILDTNCLIKIYQNNPQDTRGATDIIECLQSRKNPELSVENSIVLLTLIATSQSYNVYTTVAKQIINAVCSHHAIDSAITLLTFFLGKKELDLYHLAINTAIDKMDSPSVDKSVKFLDFLFSLEQSETFIVKFLNNIAEWISKGNYHTENYLKNPQFSVSLVIVGDKYGWNTIEPSLIKLSNCITNTSYNESIAIAYGQFLTKLASMASEDRLRVCLRLAQLYDNYLMQDGSPDSPLTTSFHCRMLRSSDFVINTIHPFVILKCEAMIYRRVQSIVMHLDRFPILQTLVPAIKELDCRIQNFNNIAPLQILVSFCITNLKASVNKLQLPSNWSQNADLWCSCPDCTSMMKFLKDPNKHQQGFKLGKGRRAHLHQQLDGSCCDVTHVTEHIGNPHTLVVTKSKGKLCETKEQSEVALLYLEKFGNTVESAGTTLPVSLEPASKRQKSDTVDLTN